MTPAPQSHVLPGEGFSTAAIKGMGTPAGVLVALGACALYLLFPNREFYWDGVGFALAIESPQPYWSSLLHPNHLVYNLAGYYAWKAADFLGMAWRALFVLQALNALLAAAGVWLLWKILAGLTGSARCSLWGAVLFAGSSQWWRFASDADAYIPSVFFLLLSFRWLFSAPQPRAFAAGIAQGAAMLFHQLALFFLPAAIFGILVTQRPAISSVAAGRNKLTAVKFVSAALGIVAFAYVAAFRAAQPPGGVREIWNWITHHSGDSAFSYSIYHGARFSMRGTMRLFFGGRVNQVVWPDLVTAAGAIAFCVILCLFLYYGWRALKEAVRTRQDHNVSVFRGWLSANRPSLAWIAAYAAFLTFWLPQNTFYRIFYLPPLVLLLVTAPVWHRNRVRILALLAAAACVWNFTVSVYPRSKPEMNEVLSFALQQSKEWGPGSMIIYRDFHPDLWTIRYFNRQAEWLSVPSPDADQLERLRLKAAQKHAFLWIEETAYESLAAIPAGQEWLHEHVDPAGSLFYDAPPHRIRFFRVQ